MYFAYFTSVIHDNGIKLVRKIEHSVINACDQDRTPH